MNAQPSDQSQPDDKPDSQSELAAGPESAKKDAYDGDHVYLVAAANFMTYYEFFQALQSAELEMNWETQYPDVALKFEKSPNIRKDLQFVAGLLQATQSAFGGSQDLKARIAGYGKHMLNLKSALEKGDAGAAKRAFQEHALYLLKFLEFRDLNTPLLLSLTIRACETNDQEFFKSLGRTLAKKPRPISDLQPELLAVVMVGWWDDPRFGPLCRLTDEALKQ